MVRKTEPGLISLNESRRNRQRQMVTGRAAIGGGIPLRLFGFGMLFLAVAGFVYYRRAAGQLESQRAALLAQQRAVDAALGTKLRALRDGIETRVRELAERGPESFAAPGVSPALLMTQPGVYLRLRAEDARTDTSLRKAAMTSLRDGFTACLAADPKALPAGVGKACKESAECAPGELCTEFKTCQRPSSPFNMRFVYRAMSVLEPAWITEVKEAKNEFSLLARARMLESITQVDVPLAIEVHQRARYALIVLDESTTPKEGEKLDPGETQAEFLQRLPHTSRVGLWSLPAGELLAYLRTDATGELRDVGQDRAIGGQESVHARARLANSCSLALEVKKLLSQEVPSSKDAKTAP
jgi:hypothetical protein